MSPSPRSPRRRLTWHQRLLGVLKPGAHGKDSTHRGELEGALIGPVRRQVVWVVLAGLSVWPRLYLAESRQPGKTHNTTLQPVSAAQPVRDSRTEMTLRVYNYAHLDWQFSATLGKWWRPYSRVPALVWDGSLVRLSRRISSGTRTASGKREPQTSWFAS